MTLTTARQSNSRTIWLALAFFGPASIFQAYRWRWRQFYVHSIGSLHRMTAVPKWHGLPAAALPEKPRFGRAASFAPERERSPSSGPMLTRASEPPMNARRDETMGFR
jgi:hypothetical protein